MVINCSTYQNEVHMPSEPILTIDGICKSYDTKDGSLEVLRDVSLHADANEFVSIVGPSGCGKSTLFNIINGLLDPSSGTVSMQSSEVVGGRPKDLGYVLQKDLLMPWRTVIDNVIVGLEVQGMPKKKAIAHALPLLARYRLDKYKDHFPSQLSGGMRQRVALMRTMVTEPRVILMDEAYKALDYPLKISLETELLEMVKREQKTCLFVTHDIEEAITLSDRIYVMQAHPGRIVEEITVDLGVDSYEMHRRRMSPRLNEYYERVWRSIEGHNRQEAA